MISETNDPTKGLETEPGDAPTADRKVTGDPAAPPAAATDTLNDLQVAEAEARMRQAGRAERERTDDDAPGDAA